MSFEPVNELEKLLIAASSEPSARPTFLKAILEHDLFVITEDPTPSTPETVSLAEGSTVSIRAFDVEGKRHIPIFSSVERISAVIPETVGYLAIKGRDLFEMIKGSDVFLNPGSDYGKIFFPEEIDDLLSGKTFDPSIKSIEAGGKQILLGQPKEYPHHITKPLQELFARIPQVKAAYLAHVHIPEMNQPPHSMIGIVVTGDSKPVMDQVGEVLNQCTSPNEIVDLAVLPESATDTVGSYMQKQTKPFYQKKRWFGIFN